MSYCIINDKKYEALPHTGVKCESYPDTGLPYKTMGFDTKRQFFSFQKLIDPAILGKIKNWTKMILWLVV